MSEKLDRIIDELSTLTVLEMSELVKKFEDKFGVSAAMPMQVAQAAPGAAAAVAEKTEFDVVLESDGGKKLDVIKALRVVMPSLQLGEAKAVVEKAGVIASGVNKDEAEKIKKELETAGAVVKIQ